MGECISKNKEPEKASYQQPKPVQLFTWSFIILQDRLVPGSHYADHGATYADFSTAPPPVPAANSPPYTVTSEFQYLDEDVQCEGYMKKGPKFNSVPALQQPFKKVFEKYEIVLMNRQKIDEALGSFKQILGVDRRQHMSECFEKWRSLLDNPNFNITCTKNDDLLVETITVVAPRHLRPAQTHINELLAACHLFFKQFQFLLNTILEGLGEASKAKQNIGRLTEHMSYSDQMDLKERVPRLFEDYDHIPGLMSKFHEHIGIILKEISDSAYCLRTQTRQD